MIQRNILALLVAQLAIGGMACGPQVRWESDAKRIPCGGRCNHLETRPDGVQLRIAFDLETC
jgi:hypothetical protein